MRPLFAANSCIKGHAGLPNVTTHTVTKPLYESSATCTGGSGCSSGPGDLAPRCSTRQPPCGCRGAWCRTRSTTRVPPARAGRHVIVLLTAGAAIGRVRLARSSRPRTRELTVGASGAGHIPA
jgi:hypothetical protein